MTALEVFINGHRICLAGVGADGVLSAIVNCVGPEREKHIFLSVGGLDSIANEHLHWDVPSIGVGAEVLVRVVEVSSVDPPAERVPSDKPGTRPQLYLDHLRELGTRMTPDERRELLRELIADLECQPSEPSAE